MKLFKPLGTLALSSLTLAALTTAAHADFVSVSIESQTNANIRNYTGGSNYPTAPTNISVANVPFQLVTDQGASGTLGVVQTPGGNSTFTILTNITGASTIYTLMNSAFGQAGANIGSIEFIGAKAGDDVTFQIVEGNNIRDHFNDGFNNSATNIVADPFLNGVQNPAGPDRLDMQTFVLPTAFGTDTLTEIIFRGANAGNPQGEAFLAAATAQTVPEPASLTLLGLGAVGLAGCAFRRRRAVRSANA